MLIEPAGGNFNYSSNVTITLGFEDLTNMVEGIYRAELGRPGDPSEISDWSAYAEEYRSFGYTDEEIRLELITYNVRNSSEYISNMEQWETRTLQTTTKQLSSARTQTARG
jgi:hypothetical protein